MTDWNAAQWRKSSYSGSVGDCVDVAPRHTAIGIRDTKNRAEGPLVVSREAWRSFVRMSQRTY